MKHPFLVHSTHIRWSQLKPKYIESDIHQAIENCGQRLKKIGKYARKDLTYQKVLVELEAAVEALNNAWTKVVHLDAVCNSPALRKVYNKMLPKVSEFLTSIHLDENLWKALKSYAKTSEAKKLKGIRKRFLEETLKDFQESGADLSKEDKKKLAKIEARLAQVTQKYAENVLDATNAWELVIKNEKQLKGLPVGAKEAARESALAKGYGNKKHPQWRFTLQAPSMLPVLQYLEEDGIRKKVWEASVSVGKKSPYDNTALIKEVLSLRDQKAQLLGKQHFADWVLQRRMAKTGMKALKFVEDLHKKVRKQFLQEIRLLENYKAKELKKRRSPLNPWEVAYWAEKRKKALFDFDDEQLRPYFPIDQVIQGMYTLAEKLFGIKIRELKRKVDVWQPQVKVYEVFDKGGKRLGLFYADWHPRESKRGGAWMNHFYTGNKGEPHVGVICGNLTPPLKDKPALLTHGEVETIFHEFGHLLHHLLSDVEIKGLQGTRVAWDFVELPSQIMENWCWERKSLDLFARHYKTGEKIPEALFKKMMEVKNYLAGLGMMRQLSIAKMDLALHIHYKKYKHKNLDKAVETIVKGYVPRFKVKVPSWIYRLTHVFADPTGYAAGYYSYKWAEVLDADAFTRFKKEGILNSKIGREFRQKILAKGNSAPAEKLYKDFMGRGPRIEALLERSGILIKK